MYRHVMLGVILATSLACSGCGSWFYMGQHPSVAHGTTMNHMPEEVRQSVNTVEVIADDTRPELWVGGDYGQQLPTAGEGAVDGMAAGTKLTGAMVAEDPRTVFLVPLVLPVALVAGGIGGAAAAKIEQELAEFREGLADELVADGNQPSPGDALADALVERLEATDDILPVKAGGDASLTVSVTGISVDTDDKDATVTAFVTGTLNDPADNALLYVNSFRYAERDKLRNWTADENALWASYVVRARQFIVAEIIADMFETIHVRHVLRPSKSDTFSGGWNGRAKTDKPTFSWELFLLGDDQYSDMIDEQSITYDLRIFEEGRLVYDARGIADTSHELGEPMPRCKKLRWSVRPVYQVNGKTRAGDWMQYRSGFDKLWNNEALEANSVTPAFWQYFPQVSSRCSS